VVVAGFERLSNSPAETSDSEESGAESGALKADSAILADPQLARIVRAWPGLPADLKRRILTLIKGAAG